MAVVATFLPDTAPDATDETSDRHAPASAPPMSGPGGAGVRRVQNVPDKRSEGTPWLIKLKRIFGLK